MKNWIPGLLSASLLLLAAGCADDDEDNNPPPPALETHVQITVNPDTLWFVTGDTTTADVSVLVACDCCSRGCWVPRVGAVVQTSLVEPFHGWLTPMNPQQGDMTDSLGRIRYVYHTTVTGADVIEASCEGVMASARIMAAHPYEGESLAVGLFLVPQTINLSLPGADTTRVHATAVVHDEQNRPVPGLAVEFSAQRGWMNPPTITDGDGAAETWWHQPAAYPDTAWTEITVEIVASIGIFQDSGLIVIRQ